tara:strand:- start:88 stop:1611 length:1524 start_codon:yes stop_codon:yes gene_type:complete
MTEQEARFEARYAAEAAAAEQEARFEARFAEEKAAESQPIVSPPEVSNLTSAANLVKGFPERLSTIVKTRAADVGQAIKRNDEGGSSSAEMYLQMLGKGGAGTVMDVLGETVSTTIGAVSDLYDPQIRQGFNDLMEGLATSDAAKSAINMYQGMDENTRANVESIFNIGGILSPFKFKAKVGSGLGDTLREGTKVVDKAADMKKNMLRNLFQPERSSSNIDFELRNGTEHIDKMVNDLVSVKGVSPMYTPQRNLEAINKHMSGVEARIQGSISQFDKTGIMGNVEKSFSQLLNDTINNAPSMRELGLPDNKKVNVHSSLMRKFNGIISNMKDEGINPNSLKGLLLARRKLDKVLRDADFKKMTDGQIGDIALEKHIVMTMRSKINDVVSGFVEQGGASSDNIKELLKKQSSMYSAFNNLAGKTARAEQNIGEKGWLTRAFSSHPLLVYSTMKSQGTPAAAAAMLAAPSAIKLGSEGIAAANRVLAAPRLPVVRSGLFYGADEQQPQQ